MRPRAERSGSEADHQAVNLAWCYVVRDAAGAGLKSLRLVDRRRGLEWSAPPAAAGSDPAETQPAVIAAAARWLADRLGEWAGASGGYTLRVCLDADGGRCAWLSAPSGEQTVVEAAVNAAAIGSGDDGTGGPGVWDSAYGQSGLDLSVQALSATAVADRPRRSGGEDRRERLAVLAMPDLAARLLLDELDRLGLEVDSVTSLWHAAAQAWDPAAGGGSDARAAAAEAVVVAESEPVSAQVLVDPSGRLVWGWSRAGRLIAAGAQRVRKVAAEPATAPGPREGEAGEGDAGARRLVGRDGVSGAGGAAVLELHRADAGRVINDWLAWSLQLGVAPSRIVCMAPSWTTCSELAGDLPTEAGAAALARTLAQRWPGAATLAQVEDDPVGLTLTRLADAGTSVDAARPDPRQSLLRLSGRPRRLTRRMYRWMAAALAAGGVALGVLAWKVERGAALIGQQADDLRAARAAELAKVKDFIPNVERDLDPARLIRARIIEAEKSRQSITHEPPIWALLDRLIKAAGRVDGARLDDRDRLRLGSGVGASSGLTIALASVQDAAAAQAAVREETRDLPVDIDFSLAGSDLKVAIRWREAAKPGAAGSTAGGGGGAGGAGGGTP